MTDRIPVNVLPNGAIRQLFYDESGNLLRTEYVKKDDGAIVAGTALNKANLLPDATATLLGLNPANDPAIKDAFNNLAVLSGALAPTTSTVGAVGQFYLDLTTPALYQCTAVAGSVYTWSSTKGQILYEKIRDIANATATNSISIDVSDIDWTEWREIRLMGEVSSSSGTTVILRANGNSAAYARTLQYTGSGPITSGTSEIVIFGSASTTEIHNLDVSATPQKNFLGGSYFYRHSFTIHQAQAGGGMFYSGIARLNENAALTSFNLVAVIAGGSITLGNAALWGIKR